MTQDSDQVWPICRSCGGTQDYSKGEFGICSNSWHLSPPQESQRAGSHSDLPTTPGEDKGSAAQSEPISELEQWLENRLFTYLDIRKSAYTPEQLKEFAEPIQARLQKSFQDGVNKALSVLPEPIDYPDEGADSAEFGYTVGYNHAISQAKENIGRLKS